MSAQAIPENSHCGVEPGNNNDAFVDHAQLTRAVQRLGTQALLNVLRQMGGNSPEAMALREEVTLVGIPRLNVDGGERDTRQNFMSWADVVEDFPQLAGAEPSWNYRASVPGFDINSDFNPDLDYVPRTEDFPGTSAHTGWFITPAAQASRDVYQDLGQEFGTVDYFVDLHNQWSCYKQEGTNNMSTLSISGRFISDPTQFGDWPRFDYDASRRASVAVYDALQDQGNSAYGDLTLYPQEVNLPGVEVVGDDTIDTLDPEDYEEFPDRVFLPAD